MNLLGAASGSPITIPLTTSLVGFTPTGAGTISIPPLRKVNFTYDPLDTPPGDYTYKSNDGQYLSYDGSGHWSRFSDGADYRTYGFPASVETLYLAVQALTGDPERDSFTFTPAASASGNVSSVTSAADLASLDLTKITGAISDVATYRAQNGASQSRLNFAMELNTINKANLESANSRISDVDVAQESTNLARFNILVQAGTAMLGQANQSSQAALRLLG